MSERTVSTTAVLTTAAPSPSPATTGTRRSRRWVTPALLLGVVAIFVLCFAMAPKSGAAGGEAFGGTDSKVTDILSEHGVKPWAHPLFEPGSSEVESGLFATQAALGAGLFGFFVGNLRGRKVERDRLHASQHTPGADTAVLSTTPADADGRPAVEGPTEA